MKKREKDRPGQTRPTGASSLEIVTMRGERPRTADRAQAEAARLFRQAADMLSGTTYDPLYYDKVIREVTGIVSKAVQQVNTANASMRAQCEAFLSAIMRGKVKATGPACTRTVGRKVTPYGSLTRGKRRG